MLDFGLVASGVAIGLAVAAPIGPVNLVVIRRTLRFGSLNGLISGSGAALGDGFFAALAAFSLTAAIDFFLKYELLLQLVGGIFLIGLGLRTLMSHPHLDEREPENLSGVAARVFLATFLLTVTNPATMLGFIAIFGGVASLGATGQGYGHAATLVVSVIVGSLLWWLGLSQFVNLFRQRMNDHLLEIVNRVSGILIAVFGAVVLARVVWKFFG
ncbi:MAG: LysE family translocator [Parvibaculum sp.]|uniref:LysE family translocator n=1 Tax=Parvibaculum sp. TaxID=2024848 RepID=UPI0025D786B8|nr:LysE family transporter [Parvibaculum sp.]MCE9649921.1 LysE family translocator [Parvibaculum sp.]